MADAAKSPNDVAKPGTTAPSATSKPVIVGHTTSVQDPMVSTAEASKEQPSGAVAPKAESTSTSTGSSKPKIMPTTATEELKKQAKTEEDKQHAEDVPVDEKKEETPDYQARLGEIIESGEYNVSISQAKGGAKTFLITVLAIVLIGLLVGFVLIDLKIIDVGVDLPFEIFK